MPEWEKPSSTWQPSPLSPFRSWRWSDTPEAAPTFSSVLDSLASWRLLLVMLGMLSRHVGGIGEKAAVRARVPEFASYVVCVGILIAGIKSLAGLGLSPVQITLGLLLVCSLSLAVLVVGMMSTVVRSLKR